MKRNFVLSAGLASLLMAGIVVSVRQAQQDPEQTQLRPATSLALRDAAESRVELGVLRASRSRLTAAPSPAPSATITSSPAARRVVPYVRWSPSPTWTSAYAVSTPVSSHAPIVSSPASSMTPGSSGGSVAWAHSRAGFRVSNCESGDRQAPDVNTRYNGNAHLQDRGYSGKWQDDSNFWSSYGGLAFASTAAGATEAQQDQVNYRGFLARGWQPWSCSAIMGVR